MELYRLRHEGGSPVRRMGEGERSNAASFLDSALAKSGGVPVLPCMCAAGFALSCTLSCGRGVPEWALPAEKYVLPRGKRVGSALCGMGWLDARGYRSLLAFGACY